MSRVKEHGGERLHFMTPDHHRVRNYVVSALPQSGAPLEPQAIARMLDLPLERVAGILDDLETHLTFLVRNNQGAVSWAFPLTVEKTPHALLFDSGERLYAA